MPLDKRYLGRQVTRTRRRGDMILVRLRNEAPSAKPNTWIKVTEAEYRQGVTYVYRAPVQADGGA